MLDRQQLRAFDGDDLPLHILEQDYLQALFLSELYREVDTLVFTGGTYLRHAHGLDRYSEDLDFTAIDAAAPLDALAAATERLQRYGVGARLDDVDERADAVLATLRYDGPLYDGTDRSRGSIQFDVSTLDEVIREPTWQRLFLPYPETRVVTARCLSLAEALAETIRALGTRTRGRDLYDCWYLLNQDVAIDIELVEHKFAAIDATPELNLTVGAREYARDMEVLVEQPPAYETILSTVRSALDDAGVLVRDCR